MNARKLVAIAAIALIAGGLGLMANTRLNLAPVVGLDLSQAPTLGSPDAVAEIVLIESFTCPACRSFEQNHLPRLVREFVASDRARLYFVHFQLDSAATLAGIAAECVRVQSEAGFWQYKGLLYRTQGQGFAPERLLGLARDYLPELELSAFERCLVERQTEERVRSDYAMARAAGVKAVPAVLVDGRLVAPNYYAIRTALGERR